MITDSNVLGIIMSLGDYGGIFPSHSEDHGSGKHDWEIYSEWKNFAGKNFGKMKILGNGNLGFLP